MLNRFLSAQTNAKERTKVVADFVGYHIANLILLAGFCPIAT